MKPVFIWNLIFLQKQAKNSCFYTKISELFGVKLGNSGRQFHENGSVSRKTVQFHENGKFTQKISELCKFSVIVIWRYGQFHAKKFKYATKLILRWSKLPSCFEIKEILIEIVDCMVKFLIMNFQFHACETRK